MVPDGAIFNSTKLYRSTYITKVNTVQITDNILLITARWWFPIFLLQTVNNKQTEVVNKGSYYTMSLNNTVRVYSSKHTALLKVVVWGCWFRLQILAVHDGGGLLPLLAPVLFGAVLLPLGTSVLVPCLHMLLCQPQGRGQCAAVQLCEVFLPTKLAFEFLQLHSGERCTLLLFERLHILWA